ncbi:hypothetical protein CANMA_000713 [Candida margitis]|uniref:uncharacterized protein n=1 Tax=Candida margitis TaxID=1775924 RepID=UPI002225EB80|nr:uncharacterized protein CANMA_000713 [Candida margitis]KAI5970102.1 hypothetical protein CANMA_000713 [Candida margitis]
MSLILKRFASSTQPSPDKKAQAAQLAVQSLKDFGSLLSPSSDDATQPIDTKPIYANPQLFPALSLLHQGQVVDELQSKYDKNWNKLSKEDKLLGYFISYGDWGVREKFSNWNKADSAPLDLPFHVPSKLKSLHPKDSDMVMKLEPVKLSETPVRINQFDYKKMDPASKVCIYLIVFIAMLAIYRDKNIGEAGRPVEVKIEDQYEVARQQEIQEKQQREIEEQEREKQRQGRKWYYLWLK